MIWWILIYSYKINRQKGPEIYHEQLASYKERLALSEACALYYDEHKNSADMQFEYFYTDSYDDRNRRLKHYVCDILWILAEDGNLAKNEVIDFFKLI